MIAWKLLDCASVPDGNGELRLYQRGAELSIRASGVELMNSRVHASEDALAELACARVAARARPRLLIGGLGMGYTLAAALRALGPTAEVVVAELVPAVVEWNRTVLAHLAGAPLVDPRVQVRTLDVARVLRERESAFDAIVLDVDNGPEGLTRAGNDWLYGRAGLAAAHRALCPKGVLGVWSVSPDRAFTERLRGSGFLVDTKSVRARSGRGAHHLIWIGRKV